MKRAPQLLALAALLSSANLHQARASPLGDRGVQLLHQGKTDEAVAALGRALEQDPKSAALTTDLAVAEEQRGHAAEAERLFRRAIELDPHRFYAYANLASMKVATPLSEADRDALIALLERGLSLQKKPKDGAARAGLLLAMVDVERAAGHPAAGRSRLLQANREALTPAQARRAQALREALDAAEAKSEEARAFEPWPEPPISPELAVGLAHAESQLGFDPAAAEKEAARLIALHPAWRAPRFLRARALIALEQLDAGTRELDALLRLDPLHAAAWRLLGETLAGHGGQFETERADAALRHALALEPAWTELWETRGRLLFRNGRAAEARRVLERELAELQTRGEPIPDELNSLLASVRAHADAAPQPSSIATEPSATARDLVREAQQLLDAGDSVGALDRLGRALADSPSLIDAAVLRWSLTGAPPQETAKALWSSPAGLLALIEAFRAEATLMSLREGDAAIDATDGGTLPQARAWLDPAAMRALVRPWIDRAAELSDSRALLLRAQLRAGEGDRAGALEDLGQAVASGLSKEQLDEAQAMRGELLRASRDESSLGLQLALAQPPEATLALFGSACARGGDPAQQLIIGAAHDLLGELEPALACYRFAAELAPQDRRALLRLSRAAVRAPVAWLPAISAELALAADQGIASASLARARMLAHAGRNDEALAALDKFFAAKSEPGFVEPGASLARALRIQLSGEVARASVRKRRELWAGAAVIAVLAALVFLLYSPFFRGRAVERALRREPSLFPAVARAVAEIRHEAMKHRASALSMLGLAPREEIRRALIADRPASSLIEGAYAHLFKAAGARGIALRQLEREPVFGALFADLREAETQLQEPEGPNDARIRRVAASMQMHSERLTNLLKLGARTRVDAEQLTGWIGAVESELRARELPWSSPALELQGLELDFPIAKEPLAAIFSNLMRNAQAASAKSPDPRVLVRVAEERDPAGRKILELRIGDSSAEMLSLEAIESRESGRGLSLVRDLVREWQGHLRVHKEELPLQKSIAACFPFQNP